MSRMYMLVSLFLVFASLTYAQSSSGRIQGSVRDAQDAVILGATVTVTDIAKSTSRTFRTSESGEYVVPFLDPGQYSITVESSGFKKETQSGITVRVADRLTIDFHLQVGAIAEQVTVEAATPLLNLVTNTLGQVIENRRIVDLPLEAREPFSLAALTPGVVPVPPLAVDHQGGSIPAMGGAANFTSEVTIDGMPDTTPRNQGQYNFLIYTPSIDAVSEFKVQSNCMSAEFGKFNGGVISVVTKSGTNELHGTAYEFLRNSFLDANSFFNNRARIPLAALHRSQVGGVIGGPIIIPKVYSGKNRTFFFFDYEAFRESALSTASYTVPTLLERAGDFSKTVNASGAQVVIYDPTTLQHVGTSYSRAPFPGNVIPTARVNTVGKNLAAFYPKPTNTNLTSNVNLSGAQINHDDTFDIRLDHYIGTKQQIFGRYSHQVPYTGSPNYYGNVGDPDAPPLTQYRHSGTVQYILTLNPNTILNLNYGITRMWGGRTAWGNGYDITQLGFPTGYAANQQVSGVPIVSVGGYSGVGNGSQNYSTQMSHIFQASLTRIQGSHTLKTGFDFRAYYDNQLQNPSAEGVFSTSANWTQGPDPNQASSTGGNGVATLLLGIPSSGSIINQPAVASRSSYWAGYLQDDWKITRRLTLNLGFRYEVDMPRTERYNRLSVFEVNAVSPIASAVPSLPGLRGAMLFRGPTDRALIGADLNNVGPRFGFAYELPKGTVIRGGYGIFYGLPTTDAAGAAGNFVDGFQATTNVITSLDGLTPIATLSNPYPNGFNQPLSHSQLGPASLLGQGNTSAVLSLATPYFQQWNLSIQHSFGKSLFTEVAYAANKGTDMEFSTLNLNTLTPDQNALGTVNQQLVANPFYGIITDPTSSLSLPTVTVGQLIKPYPQYGTINAYTPSIGNSVYHSLQVKVEQRFSHGFTLLAAYTFAKLIDDVSDSQVGASTSAVLNPYNLHLERAVDAQDVPQRLALSGLWELPFGHGRLLGGSWNKTADRILGGWQLNSIATFQSGQPLTMTAITGTRPVRLRLDAAKSGPVQARLNQYFDPSAYGVPVAFHLGNDSRTESNLRGPGISNFDASILKAFPIYERLRGQLRFEAFNVFNRVWFSNPGTSAGSTSFGVISSQQNRPRQLQVALKLTF